MKTRAALAFAAGKPLEVIEVDLKGMDGKINIDDLITHTMPPDGDLMHKGESIRSVVIY